MLCNANECKLTLVESTADLRPTPNREEDQADLDSRRLARDPPETPGLLA